MLSLCFNRVATVVSPFRFSVFHFLAKLAEQQVELCGTPNPQTCDLPLAAVANFLFLIATGTRRKWTRRVNILLRSRSRKRIRS